MTRGNGTGPQGGNGRAGIAKQSPRNGHETAPFNGPHFGIIPRWVAPLDLTGHELRVLLVIACYARKETRIAQRTIVQIAEEVNLDRRNVQRAIRRLEARGIVKRLLGGGRVRGSRAGRSSEYQIILTRPADTTNSGNGVAVSNAGDVQNNANDDAVFGQETASFSGLNNVTSAAPSESEQKERTPPSGESHARARGADLSNNEVDGRQGLLLLPFNRRSDLRALLKNYNPSAALVDLAREQHGINALDDRVLGEFIDWHIEHNKLPRDIEAIEAAYRRWIRREWRLAEQSRHRPQQRSDAGEADTAAAAEFFERTRELRTNGAVQ